MPSRNLRWVLTVAGLAALVALVACERRPKQEAKVLSQEVRFIGDVQDLVPGQQVHQDLRGGEGHAYQLTLKPKDYVEIEADQQGIDVAVRLLAPGGTLLAEVDSPNGSRGPESACEVAETGGTYRLEVVSDPEAKPGRYALTVSAPRQASDLDRQHLRAWKHFQQGEEYRRTGAFDKGLEAYRQALQVWQDTERPGWEAQSLFRIGWMHQALKHFDEALAPLQEAQPTLRRMGRLFEAALVSIRISSSHLVRGELVEALAAAQEAQELARKAERPEAEAGALRLIGSVYKLRGERERALETYRAGLARAQAVQHVEEEGFALYEIGDLLVAQGKLQAAVDTLEQALPVLQETGNPQELGRALRRLGNVDQRRNDKDSAEKRLRQAVLLAEQTGDRGGEATALSSLGTLHLLRKETEEAGDLYRRSLKIFQEEESRLGEATAHLNLGRYGHQAGQPQEALASYDRAIALFQSLGDQVGEASALFGSAQVLHDQKDFSAADARLQQVVAHVERLRSESDSQDLRASFFATKQHYFDLHADVLMHLHEGDRTAGYDRRALELNERRRARSFLERLEESRAGLYRTADAALLDQQKSLQQSLNATEREAAEQREQLDEKRLTTLAKRQRELLEQLDAVQTEIKKRSPLYIALTQPEPLTLDGMQTRVLEKNTLLLVYSLGEERSFLWLVPPRGEIEAHALPSRAYLEKAANHVRDGWGRRSPNPFREGADRWSERLSAELLKPVAFRLGGKRLLIVADGALQYLPFAALPDPRTLPGGSYAGKIQPLVAGHEIIHLPSASVLAALRLQGRKSGAARKWAAIFADPVFTLDDPRLGKADPASEEPRADTFRKMKALERSAQDLGLSSFQRLPHTADEVEILREVIASRNPQQLFAVDGPAASLATLRSMPLKDYKILHFATHGLLNPEHPELSGLVLSLFDAEGRPQDGFLLAHEICNLDLQADLVVLSACQTGVGPEVKGEGLVGLTRSFMYAGAPRVLVSLWNISDRATPELMRRFYKAMIHHRRPPTEALRCAQLSMSRDPNLNDPYLWAPFIFQGEWRDKLRSPGDPIEKVSTGAVTTNIPDIDLPGGGQSTFGCPDLS